MRNMPRDAAKILTSSEFWERYYYYFTFSECYTYVKRSQSVRSITSLLQSIIGQNLKGKMTRTQVH